MAIKITRALVKEDIREGFGTVKAKKSDNEIFWTLPGGQITKDPNEAYEYAKRMDFLIRQHLKRTGSSLI